jgi:hypothetical protein
MDMELKQNKDAVKTLEKAKASRWRRAQLKAKEKTKGNPDLSQNG